MATTIAIVGKSGSGKSTSIKDCDPETTFIINADKKDLPFPGKHKKYNSERKNYSVCSDLKKIETMIQTVANNPKFKTIIIDTLNAVMIDDEIARMKEKNYDKWVDLAKGIYEIVVSANEIKRHDLIIVFMFHVEEYRDDTGYSSRRILTSGNKLNKIVLESKFPTVLFTRVQGKGENNQFFFETQSCDSTGKSPMGMFKDFLIPNNLQLVIDKHREYDEIEEEPEQVNTPEESNYERVIAWISTELEDPKAFLEMHNLTENNPDNESRCKNILNIPVNKDAFTKALNKFKKDRKAA